MPVCTTCAHRAEYLYTTYRTKSNIRLNVCPRCSAFLDPLIEHPPLLVILDLILLKPRVFLHLLYNRGTKPLDATAVQPAALSESDGSRETILRGDLVRLVSITVAAETLVRLGSASRAAACVMDGGRLSWTLGLVLLEMVAQYATTLLLALGVLRIRRWWPVAKGQGGSADDRLDGRRGDFKPIVIPLTLLYTSILPLLLHLLLSIWYQPPPPSTTIHTLQIPASLVSHIPPGVQSTLDALAQAWHTTDRVWAGTHLLGGMSAGFGLRIVLPTRPWETTAIVLAGWAAAASVGHLLGKHI